MKLREADKPEGEFSSFHFEFAGETDLKANMTLLVDAGISPAIQFSLNYVESNPDTRIKDIHSYLLSSKDIDWVKNTISFSDKLPFNIPQSAQSIKTKLQLSYLFYNLILYNIMRSNSTNLSVIWDKVVKGCEPTDPMELRFGVSLLNELETVIKYLVDSYVSPPYLKEKLETEFRLVKESLKGIFAPSNDRLDSFFNSKKKRLFVKLALLSELAMDERDISETEIDGIIAVSEYLEIKGTIMRDYAKADSEETCNYFNLFTSTGKTKEEYFLHKQADQDKLLAEIKGNKGKFDLVGLISAIEKTFTQYN